MNNNIDNKVNNFVINKDTTGLLKDLSLNMTNTINGLSGFLELLDRRIYTPLEQEFLYQAKYSAFTLIRQIETLSGIVDEENSVFSKSLTRINLNSLLTIALMFVRKQTFQNEVNIDFEYDKKIPEVLFGDSLKFTEIINLLLENAVLLSQKIIRLKAKLVKQNFDSVLLDFELFYDGEELINVVPDNLTTSISQNIALQTDTNRLSLNLALSNEFLKQCGSRLNYQVIENTGILISFKIKFLANLTKNIN